MDRNDIERLRDPGFTIARRGYDQREVDEFLGALVDWLETDAAKELGEVAVTRKLELVGKSTARILLTAEEESAQLRRATEEDSREAALERRGRVAEGASSGRRVCGRPTGEGGRGCASDGHGGARQGDRDRRRRRTPPGRIEAVVIELKSQRDHTVQELERLRSRACFDDRNAHLRRALGEKRH